MEIIFVKNGVIGGGLEIMAELQANYFYDKGFDVTIILDKSYSQKLMDSKEVAVYRKGIKIISALTSNNYLFQSAQVKRKSERKEWFGGSRTHYYDEYGILIKTTWIDSNGQRVKVVIPVVEEYLSTLKKGDIVITMEPSLSWYIGNLELPKGVGSISQMHNQHFFLEDWIDNSKNYTTLVCLTPKTKEFYEKIYGKKDNLSVVPNPLRSKIPRIIIPHEERPLKIVVVGRLEDVKQPYDAINAFEMISALYPSATLEFYGVGKLENELKLFVKKLSIVNRIFFRGYESNLEKIFSDASLMLLTSKRESFGLVIIEAFAYAVPVVTYSTSFGVNDLVEDSKDGSIVSQGNVFELVEKSIELLSDEAKRNEFGYHGRSKVVEYEYGKVMNQWLELIKEVSSIEISNKELIYRCLKRTELPVSLYNYILSSTYSEEELEKILKFLTKAKARILNGKAYIYSQELLGKYKIPLKYCEIV